MLTLTRRRGETIRTSNGVSVTIGRIKGGQVKVHIQAPDHVEILRDEITDQPAASARKRPDRGSEK